MKKYFLSALLISTFFTIFFAGSRLAVAQATTGSIVGRVTDSSGAVVPGAEAVATNQQTGVTYRGVTGNDGEYVIHALPPSTYGVRVTKQGFEAAVADGVAITIDQKQLLNFEMKVGAVTDTVTVTAQPTMLQTQSVETGNVVHTEDVIDLPTLGRNFLALTALTPGVNAVGGSQNSFNFAINGGREYANSIQIDGVEATTNRTQDITVTPSVDSVEEFKVSTSAYSAEFGRSAGGVVSIQTKSGTNSFHGTGYEFFRPNFTTAKDYSFTGDPVPPSVLKQHNYGGTFGGPIIKNKTFFFLSYEGLKHTEAFDYVFFTQPKNQVKFLPDGSIDLSGLVDPFSGQQIPIYDPAVTLQNFGGTFQQFPGNIIPANRVSQAGVNIFNNFLPSPNLPGTQHGWFNNFQVHSPVKDDQKNADARLDQNFSDKDQLSVVFHYTDGDDLTTDPYWGHTVVPGAGDGDQGQHETFGTQEYSVTENHIFSPRLINEARFGFTRYSQNQYSLLNGQDLSTKYGLNNIAVSGFPATDAFPWIFMGIGNFFGGSTFKPFLIQDQNYEALDNVSLSQVGKHELKFGGDFRRLTSNPNFSLFPTSFFFFGGAFASMTADWSFTSPLDDFSGATLYGNGGNDLADLFLGLPLDVQRGLQLTDPHTRTWEIAFYGQDTYRVTPRLTLNYGLRYEFQAPYTERNNNEANYDPATDSLLLAGRGGNSAALMNSQRLNFGPRFGFAYQVNPKMVVRAGYGFFYSPENDGREDILTKNYPFAIQETFNTNPYAGPCASPTPCDGIYYYQMDTGIPRSTAIPIPSGASSIPSSSISAANTLESSYYVTPDLKTGYTQNYNFTVEQELGANFALELGYVGSVSHDLSYQVGNVNRTNYLTGRPFLTPNLGQIIEINDLGVGNYNSLQAKLTKRVSHNLNFQASYTYGHSIDNGPAPFNLGKINNDNPQDPRNLRAEIASSDNDIRHNFTFSGLYRLPFGRGQAFFGNWGRAEEIVLGGWQLNSVFNAQTGTPVNVIRSSNGDKFYSGLRPNLVGDPIVPKSQRTLDHYFNTAAFDSSQFDTCDTSATPGCNFLPGSAGRNLITGPGYVNLNLSLFKEFALTEGIKLQTRLETFNTLNTPHFQNPVGDQSNPLQFGTIPHTTRDNMRILQLAAKVIF
ncbi:MAG TPA: TonB-dependent receptor [Terriglobales bacterium]|nr:TonB-dependent receptor [Terriglobales bacterium]